MELWDVGRLAVLGILVLTATVVIPLGIGYYILHPVDVLMRQSRGPIQFTLADFVCLLVQWQAALGFAVSQVPSWNSGYFAVVFGFLAIAVLLVWLGGVYSLSRLGVPAGGRRLAFLTALPSIVVGMMLAATAFLSLPVFALPLLRKEWDFDMPWKPANAWNVTLILLVAGTLTAVAARLLRRMMHWVVSDCQAETGEPTVKC